MPLDPIGAAAAKAKSADFEKSVRAALLKYDKFTEYQLDKITAQLKEYRAAVLATVAQTDWQKARLDDLDAALLEAQKTATQKLTQSWKWQADTLTSMAIDAVDNPLDILGLNVKQLPVHVPIQELTVINNYVPSQIVNVTADVHEKVRGLMRRAVLGGLPGQDLVKAVGNVVGPLKPGQERPPGTVFSAADVRARTIMRTEMNRLHNLVKTSRVAEVSEKYPGVGYKWLHRISNFPRERHTALGGTIIFPGLGEKFALAGLKVAGPHDPSLPAEEVINCHCTAVVVYDATKGAESVAESPYIAGDGKQIPSAGLEAPRPPAPPPGPATTFLPDAATDPMIQTAHQAALKKWEALKDRAAAQAAYDQTFADSIMEQAKKAAAAAEHAGSGNAAKIAYHQTKLAAFERAGLKSFADYERPKLAEWVAKQSQQEIAAWQPKLAKVVADADKIGLGAPGQHLADEIGTIQKALKAGGQQLLDPDVQALAVSLEKKMAPLVAEYDQAMVLKQKATQINAKLAEFMQHHAAAWDEVAALHPELVKAAEVELGGLAKMNDYSAFKMFGINGPEHYAQLAKGADDLVGKVEASILKIQKAKAAAAKAAEDLATSGKLWGKADLDELVKAPQYKKTLGSMTPAEKAGFYEAKLAKAEKDLERAKGYGRASWYIQDIEKEVEKARKAVQAARAELDWYVAALDGAKVTPKELEKLLTMKRSEVKAWVKLRKAGKAPSLFPNLGPTPSVGADWDTLESMAGINFYKDGVTDSVAASRWWHKLTDWVSNFDAATRDAWRAYTGSAYAEINAFLRSGHSISDARRRQMEKMRACFGKGKMWTAPENLILRRGITDTERHMEKFINAKIGDIENIVGTVVTDQGFGSASCGAGFSKTWSCEIFVPKGAELAHVVGVTGYNSELELVFPPGSRFRVVRVRKGAHKTILSLEYLP